MQRENNIWKTVFRKREEIVSRSIAGETILVPVKGRLADMQRIYSLNPVADFIWKKLDGIQKLEDIYSELLLKFDVGQAEADADIKEFIEELLREDIITPV